MADNVQTNQDVSRVNPDMSISPIPLDDNDEVKVVDSGGKNIEGLELDDMRLSSIYDKIQAKDNDKLDTDPKPKTEKRGTDGRFVAKDKVEASSEEEKALTDESQDPDKEIETKNSEEDQPQTKDGEQSETAIARPTSWSPELEEKWKALPTDMKKVISERENSSHSTIAQQGQTISRFRPIAELLSKNKEVFKRHNAPFAAGIEQLINVQRQLDENPVATIQAIANRYGVNLNKEFGTPNQASDTANADQSGSENQHGSIPLAAKQQIDDLMAEVSTLRNRLDNRDASEQTVIESQRAEISSQTEKDIIEWSRDKPYYEEVRVFMGKLIQMGEADDLDDAYEIACNAKPSIRSKLMEAERKKKEADEKVAKETESKANEKKVSDAKRMASLKVGSSVRRNPTGSGKGWDDFDVLSSAYDKIQNG